MKTKHSRKVRKIKRRAQNLEAGNRPAWAQNLDAGYYIPFAQKLEDDYFAQIQFSARIKHFIKRRFKRCKNREYFRTILSKFLRIFRSQLSDKTNQRIAVQVLLEVLYRKDIVDVPVLSRFMYAYQFVTKLDHELDGTLRNLYVCWTPGGEKVPEVRDILWDIQQKVTPYTRWYPKFFAQMTINAVRCGRYDFLKFLLKRRLNVFPPQEAMPLIALANRIRSPLFSPNYDSRELVRYISSGKVYSYRRMFLVFLTVIITKDIASLTKLIRRVRTKQDQEYRSQIYRHICMTKLCLHLLTSSMPEPYVSVEDVRQFLNFFQPQMADAVEIACSCFKKVFNGSQEFSTPRSLKDLSRCQIRESIKSEKPFLAMVAKLDYPLHLKKFILYHDPHFKQTKSYGPIFQRFEFEMSFLI